MDRAVPLFNRSYANREVLKLLITIPYFPTREDPNVGAGQRS